MTGSLTISCPSPVAGCVYDRLDHRFNGIAGIPAPVAARGLFELAVGIPIRPARIEERPDRALMQQSGQRPIQGVRGAAPGDETISPRSGLRRAVWIG